MDSLLLRAPVSTFSALHPARRQPMTWANCESFILPYPPTSASPRRQRMPAAFQRTSAASGCELAFSDRPQSRQHTRNPFTGQFARGRANRNVAFSRKWLHDGFCKRTNSVFSVEPLRLVVKELHLVLLGVSTNRDSAVSLYQQLYDGLRSAILDGRLEPGTRLPSTRAAARELGIARNTVIAVFEQLVIEGLLRSRVGYGTWVADFEAEQLQLQSLPKSDPKSRGKGSEVASAGAGLAPLSARGKLIAAEDRGATGTADCALLPGLPDIAAFPHRIWARILARHARTPDRERLGFGDATGDPRLRAVIASYVTATRAVRCSPEQVVPVAGAQAALDLCARLLADPGDPAWIEEPGYIGARAALLAAGVRIVPVPVDADGIDVEAGEARCPDARIAYTTPSCQHPLGVTLSFGRRLRLLEWAERAGAFVIEDDYDSEFRYRGRPIAAMQGIDAKGRVVYVGTFSKTMFPALRVGYIIAPRGIAAAFANAARNTGQSAPQPLQAALADFIEDGHYGRHVRRMRALYASRRLHLLALLREHLSDELEIVPSEAGMQVAGWFVDERDDRAVAAACAQEGIVPSPLSSHWAGPGGRPGLHLGFAGFSEDALGLAVPKLARIVERLGV